MKSPTNNGLQLLRFDPTTRTAIFDFRILRARSTSMFTYKMRSSIAIALKIHLTATKITAVFNLEVSTIYIPLIMSIPRKFLMRWFLLASSTVSLSVFASLPPHSCRLFPCFTVFCLHYCFIWEFLVLLKGSAYKFPCSSRCRIASFATIRTLFTQIQEQYSSCRLPDRGNE